MEADMLDVHSPAFAEGETLPVRFTRSGAAADVSPPLSWSGVPVGSRSLAVTCVDHHPVAREYVHWLVVDLPADLPFLSEGASGSRMIPPGARELKGTGGMAGYQGPAPPRGSGPHPYEFTLWALDIDRIPIPDGAGLSGFEAAVAGHILDTGSITGLYER
jgi:Raf kinase inhibitor-like YbhB/YbcL family protein